MTLTGTERLTPTRVHFADPAATVMPLDTPVACPVLPSLHFRAIASTPAGEHHLVLSLERNTTEPVVFHLGPDRHTIARRGVILIAGMLAHGDLRNDVDGLVECCAILDFLAACWTILHEELRTSSPT